MLTGLKTRFAIFAMLLALVGVVAAGPLSAASVSAQTPPLTQGVTGTILGGGGFTGTFTPTLFVNQNGQLTLLGTLTGTLTDALGNVVGTVTNLPIALPVAASGTCQILHLDLGPLDLALLGLHVHLNEVVLDITAQSGSGQLLGNLLCSVAHLLDSNATSGALAGLLNQILAAL